MRQARSMIRMGSLALTPVLMATASPKLMAATAPGVPMQSVPTDCVACGKPDFWTGTNYGNVAASPTYRRVVVSGYHPLEGFEAEAAKERIALRHTRSNEAHAAARGPAADRDN